MVIARLGAGCLLFSGLVSSLVVKAGHGGAKDDCEGDMFKNHLKVEKLINDSEVLLFKPNRPSPES